MKVKIGDKIYSSDEVPILIVLTPQERHDIETCELPEPNMNTRLCVFPASMNQDDIMDWVLEEDEL